MSGLRASLEAAVESMIAVLDAWDGDPDLEDGGDREPDNDREREDGW